jgi:hypothetical protein
MFFWMVEGRVAAGRNDEGGYVLMLPGVPLATTMPELRKVLSHDQWQMSSGELVEANRIAFPDGQPFAMATATVATELIRQGIQDEPLDIVFSAVEEFIERLLGELLVSEHALAGLLGELVLLERMLRRPEMCDAVADPTAPWKGYMHDARDIRRGFCSIEVKTTTSDLRIHTIHSLNQIQPRKDEEGRAMESVFLLSVGFRPDNDQGSFTVPSTVDTILDHLDRCLEPEIAKQAFLQRLSRWGVSGQARYIHDEAHAHPRLSTRFTMGLEPLLYKVADPRLKLLRSDDLIDLIVEEQGIQYRAKLPEQIPGSPNNPEQGWNSAVNALLQV